MENYKIMSNIIANGVTSNINDHSECLQYHQNPI